jgi:hypothetical protein
MGTISLLRSSSEELAGCPLLVLTHMRTRLYDTTLVGSNMVGKQGDGLLRDNTNCALL